MTGFDFLFTNTNQVDLSELHDKAKKYDIPIPHKFQLFLNTFDISKLKSDKLLWHENNFKYPINGPIYEAPFDVGDYRNLAFEEFIKIKQLLSIYDYDNEYDEEGICSRKYVPFALSGLFNSGGGFMVGTSIEDADKIFIDTESSDMDNRFVQIEDDIFKFVSSFKTKIIDLNYVNPSLNFENVYKNWGEDFWRYNEHQKNIPS